MSRIRIILMVLVISISTPALNEAQAETSTDNSTKILAEINTEVQSAWQSYLAGKYKHAAK
jgi:hypothetical protein